MTRRLASWAAALATVGLAAACSSSTGAPEGKPQLGFDGPVTAEGTATLAAGAVRVEASEGLRVEAGVVAAPADEAGALAAVTPGQVLYGIDPPLLRRVEAVETVGGEVRVTTSAASLAELFEEADFTVQAGTPETVKADDATAGKASVDLRFNGASLYDSGEDGDHRLKLTVKEGSLTGSPSFAAHLIFSHTQVHLVLLQTAGFLRLDLLVEVEASASKTFTRTKEIPLYDKASVVFVGGVPVHVTPYVKLEIEGEVKAEGKGTATAGLRATLPLTHEIKYHDVDGDGWQHSTSGKFTMTSKPFKADGLEASVHGKLTVKAELGLKFYGVAGMFVDLAPYAEVGVSVASGCAWKVTAGADGSAGVRLDAIGPWEEQTRAWPFVEASQTLASGPCTVTAPIPDGDVQDAGDGADTGPVEPGDATWQDVGPDDTGPDADGADPLDGWQPGSVHEGAVIAYTNADLEVLRGKDALTGQLFVTGAVNDLGALETLRLVDGELEIQSSSVTSLAPLAALETVTGIVRIRDNLRLVSTAGLGSLRTAGGGLLLDVTLAGAASRIEGLDALQHAGPWLHLRGGSATGFGAVHVVDGDLVLEVASAQGLHALASVTGSVTLGAELAACNALNALTDIGGSLHVRSAVVPAFPSLARVGGLLLVVGSELTALGGFPALTEVGPTPCEWHDQTVRIENNPKLATITGFPRLGEVRCGNLWIRQNPELVSVDAFHGALTVDGELRVEWHPKLKTLRGFGALTTLRREWVVRANDALETIGSFSALATVGCALHLDDNPALVDAGSFPALWGFYPCAFDPAAAPSPDDCSVQLTDLAVLGTPPGFGALTECASINVSDNGGLVALNGFGSLEQVGNLSVRDNAMLANLAGLDDLVTAGDVWVHTNPSLGSLSGLNDLATVKHLSITGNASLGGLSGLGGLQSVTKFTLTSNPILTSLSGFAASASVESLEVTYNDALDQCTAEAWAAGFTTAEGAPTSLQVRQNGGEASCPE